MAFRVVSEESLSAGSLVSMARLTIEAPGGQIFEREVIHHPGAVVIVPLLGDDTILLVRQYRAAVDSWLLELPAGKRDVPGEPPELTATRELAEEVGMTAGRIEELAQFYNSPGFCDEHTYIFLARDLIPCANSPQGEEEDLMSIEQVSLTKALHMVGDGGIVDAKTIVGLCLTREVLRREV